MNNGLYRSISALDVTERRLEAVTTNLANVSTPGFKRHLAAHHGVSVQTAAGEEYTIKSRERVDFSQGNLERTGDPYDLALMGSGFLEVDGPRGPLYTRNGRLTLDDQGVLLAEGMPVAWDGARGQLDPLGGPPRVDARGEVSQDGVTVGRLMLTDFANLDGLHRTQEGLFEADPNAARLPATAEVHQGALEKSNASGVEELVQLIAIQRSHESASRVLGMIDQTYQRLNQPR